MTMRSNILNIALIAALVAAGAGCGDGASTARNPRTTDAVKAEIAEKWGKPLDELPTDTLVLISPHNESIKNEFGWAFEIDYALSHGRRVNLEWRDVGSGSTGIVAYLRNVYGKTAAPGIDILWGGGQVEFKKLADEGLLTPMDLPAETRDTIPVRFGGIVMRDPNNLWFGSTVSGFGFIYNRDLLQRSGLKPPRRWEDLAAAECFDLISLADPTQSGSAAMAYQMIVQSEPTWQAGWAKLLAVLSNANRFVDSAGAAANAPALGEAPIATCIDFYGAIRVAEAPEQLTYVSPKGQTIFTPDSIAVLKNPPHSALAKEFVRFVLSRQGQALWAVEPGDPAGPARSALGRQPIRKDVYNIYAGRFSPWTVNPYDAEKQMTVDTRMLAVSFSLLRKLVRAAAVDNLTYLKAARQKLNTTGSPPDPALLAKFNRLPDNIATPQAVTKTAALLRDKTQAERITTQWQQFFRDKYREIAR